MSYIETIVNDCLKIKNNPFKVTNEYSFKGDQLTATMSATNNYVCEPFGNSQVVNAQSGLKAQLRYINTDIIADRTTQLTFQVSNYFSDANLANQSIIASPNPIYFSTVNTPTRKFSQGFQTDDGNFLSDAKQNKLIEFFALKYETLLKLSDKETPGFYELASISDDGAILEAQINNQWVTLVNNDGNHPAKMACMQNQGIYLDKNSKVPLRLSYYQGPQTQIANVLLWRKISSTDPNIQMDQECGQSGTKYFFDSDQNSLALSPYLGLLQRGWGVIANNNFELPNDEVNPCATAAEPIAISNAKFSEDLQTISVQLSQPAHIKWVLYRWSNNQKIILQQSNNNTESIEHIFNVLDTSLYPGELNLDLTIQSSALKLQIQKSFKILLEEKINSSPTI